jgi:hypothetical protein
VLPLGVLISGLGAASWLVAGCHAREAGTPIGMSTAVPEAERVTPPAPPRVAWVDFEAARAWPEGAPPSRALSHRRDGSLIHVRVEPAGLEAYRTLAVDAPMPDGARVVAWHESPAGQLLGGYLLEKRGGSWSASEIDARGVRVAGDGSACLRCHDMAPTDHLFGLRAPDSGAVAPPAVAPPAAVKAPPTAESNVDSAR